MANVLMDPETGDFYHPSCRDAADAGLVEMEEKDKTCDKCGMIIEDPEEDPETLEEEKDA